ncbi:hypothetical protein QUF84_24645 [Fictibacillus enclensis]|uniref:hypothetical protein n=1 Tax=Fictibacillus enclensis TaxID=1017270 RepID=UPI0025A0A021|nr:hypothetical protein [Fictibacillus enclensis]MDM5340388.1 hypothetical protein [Fictibacillus enclensis]
MAKDITYLTVEDVETLHEEALADYGGLPGRPRANWKKDCYAIWKLWWEEFYPSIE